MCSKFIVLKNKRERKSPDTDHPASFVVMYAYGHTHTHTHTWTRTGTHTHTHTDTHKQNVIFVVSVLWLPPSLSLFSAAKLLQVWTTWPGVLLSFSWEGHQLPGAAHGVFSSHSWFLYVLVALLADTQDLELQLGYMLVKLVSTALTRRCFCLLK